jgi:hypothetical protein
MVEPPSRRAIVKGAALVAGIGLAVAGARDRLYSPELFRQTAARIPGARLALYPGKSHSGVLTHRPAIAEIVAFLTADDRPGA